MTASVKRDYSALAECNNIVDVLRLSAEVESDRTAVSFICDEDSPAVTLSTANLDRRARAIAVTLSDADLRQKPALIAQDTGPGYAETLLGCFYAGAIAIPAFSNSSRRKAVRLQSIIRDSGARTVLIAGKDFCNDEKLSGRSDQALFAETETINVDEVRDELADRWKEADNKIVGDDIAYLQYTSGSTTAPRGVVINHANLLENLKAIRRTYRFDKLAEVLGSFRSVFWLPLHHDMGLVGGLLEPLYLGQESILLSPFLFARSPLSWLRAMTRYSGVVSAAPNFAFDLCRKACEPDDLNSLDLSSWRVAICGSEMVRHQTLKQFASAFGRTGFELNAFYPSYGLAEAVLAVSGGRPQFTPAYNVSTRNLSDSRRECSALVSSIDADKEAGVWVSSGQVAEGLTVRIVDPESGSEMAAGHEGEIWIAGPSVAQGYWRDPTDTMRSFRVSLRTSDQSSFLRTGDLGFLLKGELFVTGRLKETIIVRGRKYHPDDVESAVLMCHSDLPPACVAFSTRSTSTRSTFDDRLVVVQELDRRMGKRSDQFEVIIAAIRRAIASTHGIQPDTVILTRTGSIPRTSSGKLKRLECKTLLESGNLAELYRWNGSSHLAVDDSVQILNVSRKKILPQSPIEKHPSSTVAHMFPDIRSGLLSLAAQVLNVPEESLTTDSCLVDCGLDSLAAARFSLLMQQAFNTTIPLEDLLGNLSIDQIARLVQMQQGSKPPDAAAAVPTSSFTIPATPLQLAYLSARALGEASGSSVCSMGIELHIPGRLDLPRLLQSFEALIRRHRYITAVFLQDGSQVCLPRDLSQMLRINDCSNASREEIEAQCRDRVEAQLRPKDPYSDPLFQCDVWTGGEHGTTLLLLSDLLLIDFSSFVVFVSDWRAIFERGEDSLPHLALSYADYARHHESLRRSKRYQIDREYWLGKLNFLAESPKITTRTSFAGAAGSQRILCRRVDEAMVEALKQLARSYKITLSSLFAAIYSDILAQWSGERRFCVNIPISVRHPIGPQVDKLVGPFGSNLLIDVEWEPSSSDPSFRERATRLQRTILGGLSHSLFSGVELAREIVRRKSNQRLLPGSVVYTPVLYPQIAGWGQLRSLYSATPQVLLDFQVIEIGKELLLRWDFLTSMIEETAAKSWFDSLFVELTELGQRVHHRQGDQKPVPQPRLATLLNDGGVKPHPEQIARGEAGVDCTDVRPVTLHDLVAIQSLRNPQLKAVSFEGEYLTYSDLNCRANLLANQLSKCGVKQKSIVAICLPPGIDQIVMIVAVLKAGAAYVPLDVNQPGQRIQAILNDCRAPCVMNQDTKQKVGSTDASTFLELESLEGLSLGWKTRLPISQQDRRDGQSEGDLAYIIYTSGSTGKPKGVMVSHQSVLNTVQDINRRFGVSRFDRLLGLSSVSFDLSVYDIFGSFAAGATLVIPDNTHKPDPQSWLRLIEAEGVTIWNSVPFTMQFFLDAMPNLRIEGTLRLVMLSGDWIPVSLPPRIRIAFPEVRMVSLGGATEASIWSCYYLVEEVSPDWHSIPYGKALSNQRFYIMNEQLQPVVGETVGELCIAGAGLASGYWAAPEATAQRFVYAGSVGERVFRTGDLGRYLADGNIEFLGRQDLQVKVRGFRVELGEVEANLAIHPAIASTAVVATTSRNDGVRDLVAFYVQRTSVDRMELRKFLLDRIPSYMVPSRFRSIAEMPLNVNGKIDRSILQEMASELRE